MLPFENLGRPEDAYVVDGLTDEIRSKLAGVPGLQVIARASSNEYRGTSKPLQDVARELGVRYLLTGTVRSEPAAKGQPARVRVTPELVRSATADVAPVEPVDASLDATMADVFAMQADIAGRVAGAMNVALAGGTRARLAEVPTHDPAAYDAYLRGKAIMKTDPVDLRRRLRYFRRRSRWIRPFLLAWARAVRASRRSSTRTACPIRRWRARRRPPPSARSRSRRSSGVGYGVLATYQQSRRAGSGRRADAAEQAQALSPGDPELLRPLAIAERQQGRIDEALRYMREAARARSAQRDHRAPARRRAALGAPLRRVARGGGPRAGARAGRLRDDREPRDGVARAGRSRGARRVLAVVPSSVDRARARRGGGDVLRPPLAARRRRPAPAARARPRRVRRRSHVVGVGARADVRAARRRGADARVRDTALVAVDEQLRAAPNDAQRHLVRALVLARSAARPRRWRRASAAWRWRASSGRRRTGRTCSISSRAMYMLVGQNAKALDLLEPLLAMPYYLSPAWLKIDPTFAPLRGDARFERLAASAPVVFAR